MVFIDLGVSGGWKSWKSEAKGKEKVDAQGKTASNAKKTPERAPETPTEERGERQKSSDCHRRDGNGCNFLIPGLP